MTETTIARSAGLSSARDAAVFGAAFFGAAFFAAAFFAAAFFAAAFFGAAFAAAFFGAAFAAAFFGAAFFAAAFFAAARGRRVGGVTGAGVLSPNSGASSFPMGEWSSAARARDGRAQPYWTDGQ